MPEEQADHPSRISGALGRPFTEQVAFFRNKMGNRVPTQAWDDLTGAEHDRAFMVAGAVKADLLSDLAAAVDKAITEGHGIEDFRRDFRDIVKRHGWTGWTGEGSTRGEAWRVGVIYRTNSYTSYAAGRYAQLQAGNFEFWVYRHGGALEPREEHLGWDGTPLPPDHPFWRTHYPPSDWGCSCYVVGARSERGIRRVGGTPGKALPKGWDNRDPKTGAPVGIGKGWDYAPGASVSETVQAMARKVGAWDYQIAKAFMDSLPTRQADDLADSYRALPSTADQAKGYAAKAIDTAEETPQRTLGLVNARYRDFVRETYGKEIEGFDFSISGSAVRHVQATHGNDTIEAKRGQRGVTAADYAVLPRMLGNPDEVLAAETSRIGENLVELRYRDAGETYVAIFAVGGKQRRTLALKTFYIWMKGRRAPVPERP